MNIKDRIAQALARGYCDSKNEMKTLDADLIFSMTEEVMKDMGQALAEAVEVIEGNTHDTYETMSGIVIHDGSKAREWIQKWGGE